MEQRLDAVRAVLAGMEVTEVAARAGVHRATVHRWVSRYLAEQIGGLSDRSHRPASCPHQAGEVVEVAVAEMRREHPRWGSRRIRLELLRKPLPWQDKEFVVPSERTIDRILIRHGLLRQRPRKRPKSSFKRFERPGPMQLWGIDIVGGIRLVNTTTGELREAKIVTGVDDHSRFCVMAAVVERATARAVCLAFAQALARYGVPEEVVTDNGKQFTDRFNRYGPSRGEVLFDKICRKNGITHRLTAPASPNQNGKVERFHGTFRPDFLDDADPFTCIDDAQAAVDAWVASYNLDRPHQGLNEKAPVVPADRFGPAPAGVGGVGGVELWLPPSLELLELTAQASDPGTGPSPAPTPAPAVSVGVDSAVELVPVDPRPVKALPAGGVRVPGSGEAIELDRVVPASGNMSLCGNQFWLGTARAGLVVRFWIDCEWVHLSIGGARVKSLRSRFSVNDLDTLVAQGAVPAGEPPLPSKPGPGSRAGRTVVEVERTVSKVGTVSLGQRLVLAAEILGGRRVGIYIEEGAPLLFFDPETRELLRTRPNPLQPGEAVRLQRTRPVGTLPRPSTEPIRVQRRANNSGVIMVTGQKIALGREHTYRTVTVHVSETTLTIELPDTDTRLVRRTTTQPVRSIKAQRPRTADTSVS
ncbi:IS481 family transposase [Actinopolymorpha rutila]|uniref:IS481 family transposase n=1 Tax=Actinopolymorpha rutila TaxID=446787 RepID=UPI00307FCEC1